MMRQTSESYRPRVQPKYARYADDPDWMKEGCVLNLPMNERGGSNTYDRSGKGNDGALTGCKWVENGLEFNGSSDYINCGNDASLRFGTGDFTLGVRVYINSFVAGAFPVIMGMGDTSGGEWMFRFNVPTATMPELELYASGNIASVPDTFLKTWSDCVFVRKGDDAYMYINGIQRGHSAGVAALDFTTTKNLLIGNADLAANRYLNGSISDVRIHNRALSAAEIEAMYYASYHTYNSMRMRSVCASPVFMRRNPTMSGGMA